MKDTNKYQKYSLMSRNHKKATIKIKRSRFCKGCAAKRIEQNLNKIFSSSTKKR